jgi:hypothetical protein
MHMNYRDIERRLQCLEVQTGGGEGGAAYELWIDDDPGWVLGPNGARLTQEEFARYTEHVKTIHFCYDDGDQRYADS